MIAVWESACIGHFPNYFRLWTMGTAWEQHLIGCLLLVADRAFFDPLGPGGGAATPLVTLKPLKLWPPKWHRIVYALILITTDTVMSL